MFARRTTLEVGVLSSLFLAALAMCGLYAYYTIFALFSNYDDEGYILISLKFFFEGHALYDEVYSCYQPFFYIFNWLAFGLWGAPLCHDSIRFLTIALWLVGAALNAAIAHRLTSSAPLALIVLFLSMLHLTVFCVEPGHPQTLAYLLVAAIVAMFAFMDRLPRTVFALATGFLLGLLLLTKINIGVYVLLPVGLVLAAGTTGIFFVRLQAVIGAIMIALPVMLMRSRLANLAMSIPGVCAVALLACVVVALLAARSRKAILCAMAAAGVAAVVLMWLQSPGFHMFYFAAIVTLSICSVVLLSHASRPGIGIDHRAWIEGILSGGTAIGVVLLVVILRGTSLQGILNGLFRIPLTQSSVFFFPCRSNAIGGVLALGGFAACCWYRWARTSLAARRSFHVLLAATKLLFGLVVLVYFSPMRSFLPFQESLPDFWMLPFAWLVVASEAGTRSIGSRDLLSWPWPPYNPLSPIRFRAANLSAGLP